MLDLRQTSDYAKYMKSIGWMVDGKPGNFAYIKRFPLIGSFIKIQRPENIDYQSIDSLIVKHRAFQIVIEPKYSSLIPQLTFHNFRQSKSYFVPSKTIYIDLTRSGKQILKEMHYKTRYNIKSSSHNPKLTTHISNDILSFADFWQKCALKQRGMYLSSKKDIVAIHKAFGKNANIISIMSSRAKRGHLGKRLLRNNTPRNDDNNLLSSVLLIKADKIVYYMYAASTSEGKKLFAPTLNVWEAIKLAKKLGSKVFDFEGIYDERFPIKSWQGFTRFKRSFGGKVIEHPGDFVKNRWPFLMVKQTV